jgi:hypothetical protein
MKVTPISPPRRETTWHCWRAPLSQEMELVWYLHTVGKQPGALLGNVGDHAVARQRAGFGLEFCDPVDGVAPVPAAVVEHGLCSRFQSLRVNT